MMRGVACRVHVARWATLGLTGLIGSANVLFARLVRA
jgi:hypothetical protein